MTTPDPSPVAGWHAMTPGGEARSIPQSAAAHAAHSIPSNAITATPPIFQRVPREYVVLPTESVEIQAPPQAPIKPASSLMGLLLPMLGMVIGVVVMGFAAYSSSNGFSIASMGMFAASVPTILISIGMGIYSHRQQQQQHTHDTNQREQGYRAYLVERRQRLTALCERQRHARLLPNPPLAECITRAEQRSRYLWDRSPNDADFLDLRLGHGRLPVSFQIRLPTSPAGVPQPEPLLQEAIALGSEFAGVDGVAITLPLTQVGIAGLAGSRSFLQRALRALLVQLATHHAPSEVKLVLNFPQSEAETWRWARWLPHTWSDDRSHRFLADTPDTARQMLGGIYDLLRQRQLQAQAQHGAAQRFSPAFMIVFADPTLLSGADAVSLGPLLQLLLGEGPALGAYTLFLADRPELVRQECNAVVSLDASGGRLRLVGPPPLDFSFATDDLDVVAAERFARTLAPLRLQRLAVAAELPAVVPLLSLLGVQRVEELRVAERWTQSEPFRSLAAPIGVRAGGELLALDFHEKGHGPHGLQAGATGSGKSELLQSMIASIATRYHPHEVAFVLIDYKGGGMANAFRELPHQIGIITNLGGSLSTRALAALRAELQRRQHLFDQAGVTTLDDYLRRYRQGQVREPLPHLLIIADEFAELAQNQPDFMGELISAVRVGRSLGVHLLLATQKPAGVVNEQIWGNARFRLSLRVERPEDSQEILKRPDAAAIRQPGRAYFQVGMNEVFELFQAAWGGAPYAPGSGAVRTHQSLAEVEIDGSRRALVQASAGPAPAQSGQTQLQALVAYLAQTAQHHGIDRLRSFWLPPLPAEIALDGLRTGGWDGQRWQPVGHWLAPVIGQVDDPARQLQAALRLELGKEGHLVIFGAPGSGKTTLLQTLITALAADHTPADLHCYILDFGGRLLKLFEPLPHVGGVILPDETERVNRLLRLLLRELEQRKDLLSAAGVGTLEAYRTQASGAPPAIVVALDNYTEFATAYPDHVDILARIAREGGGLGIHLILSANMVGAIPTRLASNIALAVALELNDPGEYSMAVGRTNGLVPARGVRGRGLVRSDPPLEFQAALPAEGASEALRSQALKARLAAMQTAWSGPVARPVPVLPAIVALSDLMPVGGALATQPVSLARPLGLDTETLEPVVIDLADGPHFMIAGPPCSGKTTLLQSWLLALAAQCSPQHLKLYLVSMGGAHLLPFRQLPHTMALVEDDDRLSEVADELRVALDERRQALDKARRDGGGMIDERVFLAQYPTLVLALDDFDQFQANAGFSSKSTLETLLRRSRGLGFHLLLVSPTTDLSSAYDTVGKAIKEGQTGVLLGSSDHNDLQLFNLRLPMGEAGKALPPGRGFYARRGRYQSLQVASCHAGTSDLTMWLQSIKQHQP